MRGENRGHVDNGVAELLCLEDMLVEDPPGGKPEDRVGRGDSSSLPRAAVTGSVAASATSCTER